MNNPEYDIVVVGGGIAGLYCCMRSPPELKVALFEATDRIGGKVETVLMDGFRAEYGAMRFDPSRQKMMEKLMGELHLEAEPFPEYSSPPASERQIMYDLKPDEQNLNTLELFALGIARLLNKPVSELLDSSEEELESFRRQGKHRKRFLWEQGLWNAFTDVLSYNAVKYIMSDGSFFHGIHENPGIAGTMIIWVKMLQMSKDLKGVKGGMQNITDRMLEKARSKGTEVYTGRSLLALVPEGHGKINLVFNTGELKARHVILALPSRALKAINGIPAAIRVLLETVIEYPLLKCFFVVKEPWWDENIPNKGVQTFPARELHYYKHGNKGMIMVYADRPGINFWNRYVNALCHDKAELDRHPELPLLFAEQFKINPGVITSFGIRDWTREPYGSGVHLWRAGVEPWKVSERLEAFSLEGDSPQNVHICGEAFSDYQGFMEGALRSAQSALNKVLG